MIVCWLIQELRDLYHLNWPWRAVDICTIPRMVRVSFALLSLCEACLHVARLLPPSRQDGTQADSSTGRQWVGLPFTLGLNGGIRMNRKGFTLIELLIVVVIIGILAAIAIPKFANTKAKAYIASMKSDLRNLVTAEEAYFADSVRSEEHTSELQSPSEVVCSLWLAKRNNLGTVGLAAGNGSWARTVT